MATRPPFSHTETWRLARLAEITTKIGSGATPTGGEATYLPARRKFALVRSQNVFDRRFDETGLAFISNDQAERLAGVALRSGDLLLNITGDGVTFARSCMVPDSVLPAYVNQHVAIVRIDPSKADPGFILAYLTHPQVKPYIEAFNSGGSRRAITKGHIENFLVPLPSLGEQKAIASILGSLDDKIELNRRMNETLEAMARAIFQDWFVAFGPTRAKMEGRPPYLAPELWGLFPDRLDAEGKPEGWATWPLSSIAGLERATVSPASGPDELFDHYSIPAFDAGKVPVRERGAAILSNKTLVSPGAVLLSKLNPEIPRVWLVDADPTVRSICSTEFLALSPVVAGDRAFLYSVLTETGFRQRLEAQVTGTSKSHQRVRPQSVLDAEVVMPPGNVLAAFQRQAMPLLDRMLANQRESRTLAATRDLLLPRLMSGELRVKDAERAVEAAA